MKAVLHERACELKKNATNAENRLWYFVRDRRLKGHKFVRQYIIEPYIVDFLCRDKKLIVELDGSHHLDSILYDTERTDYLEMKGYRVLRFWNNEILYDIKHVLERILEFL